MDTINLTIDGQQITARKGATVLEAASEAGIHIPTLCHHPDLKPFGACRMCLVQIEKLRGFPASCTTPAGEGMVVNASGSDVQSLRKRILELMLAEHPHACLTCWKRERCGPTDTCLRQVAVEDRCVVCPKNQRCELQQVADYMGLQEVRLRPFRRGRSLDRNPLYERDHDLCILCGRCVRACSEIRGVGAIDFVYRGHRAIIGTAFERPMEETNCEFCGTCVDFCPTGSIRERANPFAGAADDLVKTTCPYCGVGCGLILEVKGGEIVRVRGDRDSKVNKGQLCVKGKFGTADFVHHADRLTTPLIKRDGEFVEATWEEAIELVADKFAGYSGDETAVVASAKCTNEENYLLQKFARVVMGTNNVDHCARLCLSPSLIGLGDTFGDGAMTNSIGELGSSKCIFILGSNVTESHPIVGLQVKKSIGQGGKLVVANPRQIDIAGTADVWLQNKPGTDLALVAGMMRVILDEGLADDAFIAERCEGLDNLKQSLSEFPLERVAEITGVPAGKIAQAARLYATNSPAAIICAAGVTQHVQGTDNIHALADLAMLTGNVGKEAAGVNPLRGQNNLQGACDMGALPDVLPGYQRIDDGKARAKFEEAWGVSLNDKPGLTTSEMLASAQAGRLKAMYLVGENPVISDPDAKHAEAALKKLEFMVVQDIFLTETAKLADVVLPGATYAEKDGTFTNTERRVQMVRRAVKLVGRARPDWWITSELAKRMGAKGFEYGCPQEIMSEIARLTPIYGGVSYERLSAEGGLQWPCPTAEHPGTPVLHKEGFAHGKGRFVPLRHRGTAETTDGDYPLLLTTGRVRYHYHTGTMTRRVKGLNAIHPKEMVEINSVDASNLNIASGDMVKVSSRRGEVVAKVTVTDRSAPGVVFMTFHFAETPTNLLTNSALDPVSKTPELKVCAVRVEKLTPVPEKDAVLA